MIRKIDTRVAKIKLPAIVPNITSQKAQGSKQTLLTSTIPPGLTVHGRQSPHANGHYSNLYYY